jgi:hypothetical protein
MILYGLGLTSSGPEVLGGGSSSSILGKSTDGLLQSPEWSVLFPWLEECCFPLLLEIMCLASSLSFMTGAGRNGMALATTPALRLLSWKDLGFLFIKSTIGSLIICSISTRATCPRNYIPCKIYWCFPK